MNIYDTLSGKKTTFGRPGTNIRFVEYQIEQEKRMKEKYANRKKKIPPEEKIKVTDKDIDEWIDWCYNISKQVEDDSEWEEP